VTRNLKTEGSYVYFTNRVTVFYEALSMQPSCVFVNAAKISTNSFFVFLVTKKLTLKLR